MPFLRFSRDKRGYEHTYLVHAANRRGRPTRPRVLYWYRTPPGVKVGRAPFDDEMRKALESQYPGVTFDWKTLQSTPIPAPEPEYWRERRRAERAARQARQLEEAEDQAAPEPPDLPEEAPTSQPDSPEFPVRVRQDDAVATSDGAAATPDVPFVEDGGPAATVAQLAGVPSVQRERRRRRRGGRGRNPRLTAGQSAPGSAPAGLETASEKLVEAARDVEGSDESDPK